MLAVGSMSMSFDVALFVSKELILWYWSGKYLEGCEEAISVEMDGNKSAMGIEFDVVFDDIGPSLLGSILRHISLRGAFDISFYNIFFLLLILFSILLVISR